MNAPILQNQFSDVNVYYGAGKTILRWHVWGVARPQIPKIMHETIMFTDATHVNLVDGNSKHRHTI